MRSIVAGKPSRTPLLLRWLPAIALSLCVAVAHGDARSSGQAHLARGLELYRSGHYRAAIAQFEAGYAKLPRAAFLLDIAQAWRQLGQLAEARVYYQRFVARSAPRDPARAQVLALIDKIDAQLRAGTPATETAPASTAPASTAAQAAEPPSTAPSPAPSPAPSASPSAPPAAIVAAPASAPPATRNGRRAWGWAGVGLAAVGLAGLGAGVGLAVLAGRADSEYAHPSDGTVYDPSVYNRRELDRDLTIGLLVSGGALAVAGTVLAALGLRARPDRARAAITVGADGRVHF